MSIEIGPLSIRLYGIVIMLGVLVGAWLAARRAPRHGLRSEWIWDMVPWLIIGGVIGARVWHVLFPPASMTQAGYTTMYYLRNPLEAIAIWKGGLGLPGVLIGGAIALYLYLRKNQRLHLFPRFVDAVAPSIALGQAIGRWGNYFNQELYGKPTDLPWAIYIDPVNRLPGYEDVAYYHPLFLYESLWNLMNMGVLLYVHNRWRERLLPGDLFLLYLVIYGTGRFLLEFLRLDPAFVGTINANQTLMAVVVVVAAATLFWRHRVSDQTSPATVEALPAESSTVVTAANASRRRRKRKRKR